MWRSFAGLFLVLGLFAVGASAAVRGETGTSEYELVRERLKTAIPKPRELVIDQLFFGEGDMKEVFCGSLNDKLYFFFGNIVRYPEGAKAQLGGIGGVRDPGFINRAIIRTCKDAVGIELEQ